MKPLWVWSLLCAVVFLELSVADQCTDWDAALALTNRIRSDWGRAPALEYDGSLFESAQEHAKTLVTGSTCKKAYDSNSPNSQNVHVRRVDSGKVQTTNACQIAVRAWAATAKDYNFNARRPYVDNIGALQTAQDFVNLAWRSSTDVGCATKVSSDEQCMVIVCEYSPKVEFSDPAFEQNIAKYGEVPPPGGEDNPINQTEMTTGNVFMSPTGIATNLCVNIPCGASSRTPLWQWTCDQTSDDQWFVIKDTDDPLYYTISNKAGTLCWSVLSDDSTVEPPVVMDTCTGADNQQFSFFVADESLSWYTISPKSNLGNCIEVREGASYQGAQLVETFCNNRPFFITRVR